MARRVPLTALLGAGLLAVLAVLALVSDGTQTVDLQMLAGADDLLTGGACAALHRLGRLLQP